MRIYTRKYIESITIKNFKFVIVKMGRRISRSNIVGPESSRIFGIFKENLSEEFSFTDK